MHRARSPRASRSYRRSLTQARPRPGLVLDLAGQVLQRGADPLITMMCRFLDKVEELVRVLEGQLESDVPPPSPSAVASPSSVTAPLT